MNSESSSLRLAVLGVVIVSLFAALFARLYYLQVLDKQTFVEAAQSNQVRLVYEPAPRGRILDRAGRVLVDNRVSEVVTVARTEIAEHPEVVPRLAAALDLTVAELEERINDPRMSPYRPVPVAEDVPEELVVYLAERNRDFPGVEVTQLARRTYPHGALGAHVLGYVGEINDTELDTRRDDGYRLGDSIGKTGAEQAYETWLRGSPGIRKLEVDSSGKVLRTLGFREPVQGSDVRLTIDLDVQRAAEESLARGLEAARKQSDREFEKNFIAPAGSVVVEDPRDGAILAMASNPSYDPAQFVDGIPVPVFQQLQDPANHYPLNNRAMSGLYAPGSTFKLITAMAGLERGIIDARTTFPDNGALRIGNRTFRNSGGKVNGRIALPRAIAVSSNVYFATIGARFWTDRDTFGDGMQEMARRFGFGERTGIELSGEARGRVPDPEIRKQMHEANPVAFPNAEWRTGDNANLSLGQGELVATPLQLTNAYATFANGGTRWAPRLAADVRTQAGDVVHEFTPRELGHVEIEPAHHNAILQGLRGVVTAEGGTAVSAFSGFDGTFQVAGKTGTAQVARKQDSAIFVAFAPFERPEFVVTVVLEEAGFGGSTAAPVARRVMQALAGVEQDEISVVAGLD